MREEDEDESLRYGREETHPKSKLFEMDVPAADLDFFAAGYLLQGGAVDTFQAFFGCFDHALGIEENPEALYEDHKLTALQMGEGARVRARGFAMRIAVRPAQTLAELGFKIFIEMTLAEDETEWRRSHVMELLGAAIAADQRSLGVLVCRYSLARH